MQFFSSREKKTLFNKQHHWKGFICCCRRGENFAEFHEWIMICNVPKISWSIYLYFAWHTYIDVDTKLNEISSVNRQQKKKKMRRSKLNKRLCIFHKLCNFVKSSPGQHISNEKFHLLNVISRVEII